MNKYTIFHVPKNSYVIGGIAFTDEQNKTNCLVCKNTIDITKGYYYLTNLNPFGFSAYVGRTDSKECTEMYILQNI